MLDSCLSSLQKQTYPLLEVIIIDDGSQDNTEEVVVKHINTFSKGVILYNKIANSGVSKARNFGISLASGKYIMFIDADDWVEPKICESLVNSIEQTEAGLGICDYYSNSTNTEVVRSSANCNEGLYTNQDYQNIFINGMVGLYGEQLRWPERSDRLVSVWAKIYRLDIIQKYELKFVDISLVPSECQLFNLEYCLRVSSAVYVKSPLYHYRRTTIGSITKKYRPGLFEMWINYFKKTSNILIHLLDSTKTKEAYLNSICFSVVQLGGNAIRREKIEERLEEIQTFLKSPIYIDAFRNMNFNYLPLHWKVFFGIAKMRWVFGFYIITKAMRWLMDRRKK